MSAAAAAHTPFIWTRLHLPLPTNVESARAALVAIASTSGQPRVVLEARGEAGQVGWYLGCQASVAARLVSAVRSHLSDLRVEGVSQASYNTSHADAAASLRLPGARRLPLNHEAIEPATRGLLSALSRTRKNESASIQLILGPRRRPSRPQLETGDATFRRDVRLKHLEHRFGCEVRLAATSADPARVHTLIGGIVSALRAIEAPGVAVRAIRTNPKAFDAVKSPFIWPLTLSVSDLIPLSAWPIGELPLPGIPAAHPKLLPASGRIPQHGRRLGLSTASTSPRPIAQKHQDALRGTHLLGPTGVGKSTGMARMALADIRAGYGVAVVDPKGDLLDAILSGIPEDRRDDVVVLDARDPRPVGINGLGRGMDPDLSADTLLAVFHSLFSANWGIRSSDILHATLLSLARRGDASLALISPLLTNPGFRRSVIGPLVRQDPMGLAQFWNFYESLSDAERQQAIAPVLNKLRQVLLRPQILGVLGQRFPKFDLTDVFTKRRILLVDLAKGTIGSEAAQLLGSIVVGLLWQTALGRAAVPPEQRHPVFIHVDELQDYLRLPGDLGDALAQARGLGVGFTLAHQHLDQLPPKIRSAILANARSRIAFQLSGSDARDIAKTTRGQLEAIDFEELPAFHAYASLLVDGSPAPWVSLTTEPLDPPISDPAELRARSAERYGQPLSEVEADLLSIIQPTPKPGDNLGRTRRTTADQEDPR